MLSIEPVGGRAEDPLASTASMGDLQVGFRGLLFDRAELSRGLGVDANGTSNAELVLRAYERRHEAGLRRFRGIFAMFVWDGERRRLLAARDPLGIEPLFYAKTDDELLFAASPRILLDQPGVSRTPNRAVLVETLYWHWPVPEETSLEAVRRILPGHMLIVANGTVTSGRYWNPNDDLNEQGWVQEDELEAFDSLLERAVRQCLDLGPSGIFLSGGFDSVSVASIALDLARRRELATPWALSIIFPTPETSEEDVQLGVAKGLGLPQIVRGLEESVAPDGLVCRSVELSASWPLPHAYLWAGAYEKLARAGADRGVRTIMTGAGGDEWLTVDLLLSADLMRELEFAALYRFVRTKLSSFDTTLLPTLRSLLWKNGLQPLGYFYGRKLLQRYAPALREARRRRSIVRALEAELPWIAVEPELRDEFRARRDKRLRQSDQPSLEGRFRFYGSDGTTVLDHVLVSEDRENDYESGRRAGVQFMHPYWEPDLVSFLFRVPPALLLRGGLEKGLVRQTIARRFPDLGFEKQKKLVATDFHYSIIRRQAPAAWKRIGGCEALVDLGVVDGAQIDSVIADGLASEDRREVHRIWQLLTLEAWLKG
jgi:asparagine synthase (glutamine-hydrolysing)